jgi:hypothetical protein
MVGNGISVPYQLIEGKMSHRTLKGMIVGDRRFGPHEEWRFVIQTDDRDTFIAEFRAWVADKGGAVTSHGYHTTKSIIYVSVVTPLTPK